VAGVIELYRLPSALFAAIDQGRLWIGLLTLGGGGFLFLCLFWAVRRADRIMRDQHRRLVEAETAVVLGEVASAVAHSTRNAVAVIRSSAELALDEDVEGTRRCARAIVAEADRLDRWVRDLLTYANTDELDPGRVDVNTVVEDVIAGNRPRLDDRGVRLDLALAPGLPAAHVGVVPLGQVLATVIGNALDAMPGGGTLRVTTAMTPAGDGIAVTVRDSGEGMDPATLAQAFRPFFTTKRRGTGLGLALARRIATRFGGLITLDSTPGAGTTARLVLRRAV
jgi:signal transduction histidine kinase